MNATPIPYLIPVILLISLSAANANAAAFEPTEYRISESTKKFNDTWQFAMAFRLPSPQRLRANHIELAVGSLSDSSNMRAFISLGPVWHLPIRGDSLFARIGFSPTLVSGSTFESRDLGGNLHFTSSIAIGAAFGRNDSIAVSLRLQHTSNGGLNRTNPGLDMIGLSFVHNFDSN